MNALSKEILGLLDELPQDEACLACKKRVMEGEYLRDEGNASHFAVMFAAFDPDRREVFLGHHKKSDEMIFTGGHIDEGESVLGTLAREIQEEWGWTGHDVSQMKPAFVTVIDIPERQSCRRHYDIWYLFPVDKSDFVADEKLLAQEFHDIGWMSIEEARRVGTVATTQTALDEIEKLLQN